MSWDILAAMFALAVASTWTPGPNNILLASSGARFGWRATRPHALGVALGFPAMLFVLAFGLGEAFQRSDSLREGLRWAAVAVLMWLAWRIGTAGRAREGERAARPFTFLEAVAFQWINPKAWAMAVSAGAAFVSGAAPLREAAICAGVFALSGLGSAHAWAGFGAALRRFLSEDRRLRVFNLTMGLLIAASAAWLAAADI
ncbi:MAG: LysE family translocator [Rubrimonas sp.]|uniref:LysE family translocator n=1 Tax=Rubrimonas sp. TaxID=2036015 RepID=UPI002FDE081E